VDHQHRLAAAMERSFAASETQIGTVERLAITFRAQGHHALADRFETRAAQLRQLLAYRRKAWTMIKVREL
jgi:hypothetical protein